MRQRHQHLQGPSQSCSWLLTGRTERAKPWAKTWAQKIAHYLKTTQILNTKNNNDQLCVVKDPRTRKNHFSTSMVRLGSGNYPKETPNYRKRNGKYWISLQRMTCIIVSGLKRFWWLRSLRNTTQTDFDLADTGWIFQTSGTLNIRVHNLHLLESILKIVNPWLFQPTFLCLV